MKFTKMHGCGNDYVYVSGFTEKVDNKSEMAKYVSDRHFGIGSDGLIFINPSEVADCEMEMYNSDGSRAEMCGNGVRCVAKFAYDNKIVTDRVLTVETLAGIKKIELSLDGEDKVTGATVNMGSPILEPALVPCDTTKLSDYVSGTVVERTLNVQGQDYKITAVSMGNPHAVIFMDKSVADLPIESIGPSFENHPAFPKRTNTEFAYVVDSKTIEMRVWERGAGETFACGTGACATAVAAILNGYTDKEVTLKLLGGDLHISWSGNAEDPVFMEGPAVTVFKGEI